MAEIPPRERFEFLRLMVPASNHEQRVALLSGLRSGMPGPAFDGLLVALQPELPARELAALTDELRAA